MEPLRTEAKAALGVRLWGTGLESPGALGEVILQVKPHLQGFKGVRSRALQEYVKDIGFL